MNKMWFCLLICLVLVGCTSTAPTTISTAPATTLAVPAATSAPKIARLVVFGDSYFDNGNFYKIATELAKINMMDPEWWPWAKKMHWDSSVTGHPTAVQVLAEQLIVDLNDFATGGAYSGTGNANDVVDPFKNTGLLGQVGKYLTGPAGQNPDPGTLYIVQAPISDFLVLGTHDAQKVSAAADLEVANLVTAVTDLAKAGARQIMLVNLPDLSILPGVVSEGYVDEATAFQARVNAALPTEMERLSKEYNIPIKIFDYLAASQKIRANPDQYKLTNLTDMCVSFPSEVVCPSPDGYFFWDEYHPTRRVQQIIGEAMAEQLK